MKVKKIAVALTLAGLSLLTTMSHAEGLSFFPGLKPGFKFEPSLAVRAAGHEHL